MADLSPVQQLEKALKVSRLKIIKYDPHKTRPVSLNTGAPISLDRFSKQLVQSLGVHALKYTEVYSATLDLQKMENLLNEFAEDKGILVIKNSPLEIPEAFKELTLNLDISHIGRDLKFFLTTPKEIISDVSGPVYLRTAGMKDEQAIQIARKVVPEYRPRNEPGIITQTTVKGEHLAVFNSYIPPKWMEYEGDVPEKLPRLFERLVNHLFPSKVEREYFYCWLYASLFDRAYVYLILCGAGGTGKNRLKLVLRALHGHLNTVDGKRSTLTDRFNSQLAENTLAWFDELHYNLEMENVMKEIQNDSIAIEKKGVDATRSTKIYSSMVISNNKPRDNYIAFDARKFVPLRISNKRLDVVMSPDEITQLTNKVEKWDSPDYDIAFIAQIGRWIEKYGRKKKWMDRLLEYKGPMFYKLAHTSMSRWQKKAATVVIEGRFKGHNRVTYEEERGYLWSTLSETSNKKNGDRSMQFPDFSTVQNFFEIFMDANGKRTFETSLVEGSIMGDFYVRLINDNAKIVTEAEVMEKDNEDEEYDL